MSGAPARLHTADIFAVHGFASSAAVWQTLKAEIASAFSLTTTNLPGHGGTPALPITTLGALTAACAERVPGPAIWLGWSLGGLVALNAARRFPQKVRAVVAVAISPRFLAARDWPNALDPIEFKNFEALLKLDFVKALDRFYALQAHTRKGASVDLSRMLRAHASNRGLPSQTVLEDTLSILRGADLRDEAAALGCPVMTVLGEDDALVPHAVSEDLVRLNPDWRVEVIGAAGHVPFLSHPAEFLSLLESFAVDATASHRAV